MSTPAAMVREEPPPYTTGPKQRRPGRRLRILGRGLVVVGLLAAGGAGGWWLRDTRSEPTPAAVPDVVIDRPVYDAGGIESEGAMPSLVGVTVDDARQAVFQLGVTDDALTVTEAPAAGESGLVLEQEPEPGQTVDGAEVALTVAVPATVPDVIGSTEVEARELLGDLGGRVVVEARYAPDATEGTVLDVTPAAGEPLLDEAALVVAAAPSSVFAAEIPGVESGCSTSDVAVNGTPYTDALACSVGVGSEDPDVHEWVLTRNITTLDFVLGQDDETDPGVRVNVVVLVDGTVAVETGVDYGASTPVSVPVDGALRVRIEMRAPDNECCTSVTAVLADARFVGSPEAVDALVAANEQ